MATERKRMTATERDQIIHLTVASDIMESIHQSLRDRAAMVPRGRSRIGIARWAIQSLMADILDTIPTDQLQALKRNMAMNTFTVGVKRPPGQRMQEKDYGIWISFQELIELLEGCHDHCMMCAMDKAQRRACPLRKALDVIPNDVKDRDDGDCPYYGVI